MGALDDLLGQIEDEPVPGGCPRCDAYQVLQVVGPGVFVMKVVHDDWCEEFRAMHSRSN